MVYIMNLKQQFGLPSASYYDTVSQGYKDCGFDLKVLNEAVTDSAEKFYESLEQNNLFDSPDEDENMGMGGMSGGNQADMMNDLMRRMNEMSGQANHAAGTGQPHRPTVIDGEARHVEPQIKRIKPANDDQA